MTYGAQKWAFTSTQINKFKSTQNSMLRSTLNLKLKGKIKVAAMKKSNQS